MSYTLCCPKTGETTAPDQVHQRFDEGTVSIMATMIVLPEFAACIDENHYEDFVLSGSDGEIILRWMSSEPVYNGHGKSLVRFRAEVG